MIKSTGWRGVPRRVGEATLAPAGIGIMGVERGAILGHFARLRRIRALFLHGLHRQIVLAGRCVVIAFGGLPGGIPPRLALRHCAVERGVDEVVLDEGSRIAAGGAHPRWIGFATHLSALTVSDVARVVILQFLS